MARFMQVKSASSCNILLLILLAKFSKVPTWWFVMVSLDHLHQTWIANVRVGIWFDTHLRCHFTLHGGFCFTFPDTQLISNCIVPNTLRFLTCIHTISPLVQRLPVACCRFWSSDFRFKHWRGSIDPTIHKSNTNHSARSHSPYT